MLRYARAHQILGAYPQNRFVPESTRSQMPEFFDDSLLWGGVSLSVGFVRPVGGSWLRCVVLRLS